jgi:hypothetical protein
VSTPAWYGAYAAAAGLLAIGGAMKAVKPDDTANALRSLRLPGARGLVRVGGAAEALIGAWALAVGGVLPAVIIAASYLAFATFVMAAMRSRTPVSSCGCFGEVDAPPTVGHIVINIGAASVAALSAITGRAPSLPTVISNQGWAAVPLLAFIAIAGYLAFLTIAVLPRVLTVAREAVPQ